MKKQVAIDSHEWDEVDHQVQVVTGKSSIKVISVYKFEDSQNHLQTLVMKNGKEKSWIDATINITDFSKDYYRQLIQKTVPLQDVIMYAGHVNIHRYSNQPYKIFTFLLCKLFLGTAGNASTPLVQNCDSIIISPQNEQAFQYNFFVKQHSQYQVKYEVSFTVSQQKQFQISEFSCCNCENRTPAIYCATQKLNFCQDCCADHHKKKLMQSHTLEPIDRVNTLQNCKSHNQKFQLYCVKCQKYLCQQCIQKGIHAQGSDHVIKPIRYFYEQLCQNIEKLPKKQMQKLDVLLQNVKLVKKQIQRNQQQVKLMIQQSFKNCMKMLQQQSSVKYQFLDSLQLELTMLKDKVAWNQSFCLFQSNSLKPVHFFKSENKYEAFVKKIKVMELDSVLLCKPDLVYKGYNIVGNRESVQKNKQVIKQVQKYDGSDKKYINKQQIRPPNTKQDKSQSNSRVLSLQKKSTLLSYNPNTQRPKKGQLIQQIMNSNLKFFQIKTK